MEHYFTSDPTVKSEERFLTYQIKERDFSFISDNGVFSKNHVDMATDLLLKTIYQETKGEVLDIGCGYGVIGITLATSIKVNQVTMLDVNHRALELAKRNANRNGVSKKVKVIESDGLSQIAPEEKFDTIVTNPPIRAGKAVIYQMYQDAYSHLRDGRTFLFSYQQKTWCA